MHHASRITQTEEYVSPHAAGRVLATMSSVVAGAAAATVVEQQAAVCRPSTASFQLHAARGLIPHVLPTPTFFSVAPRQVLPNATMNQRGAWVQVDLGRCGRGLACCLHSAFMHPASQPLYKRLSEPLNPAPLSYARTPPSR